MAWSSSQRRADLPADWHARRRRVLRRDGNRCQIRLPGICTVEATDVDHIRRGNSHDESNLQAACHPCHAKKTSSESAAQKRKLRDARKRPAERHPGQR